MRFLRVSGLKQALECALNGEPYSGPNPVEQGGFSNGNADSSFSQTNQYKDYCSNRMKGGNWFPVWKDHLLRFGLAQALILSHLLSVGRVNSVGKGWLPYSPSFSEDATALDEEAQENALTALEEQGVIEIQMRGKKRYVMVIFQALEEGGPD